MSERFFSEQLIAGPRVTLAGDEARHLAAVMRAQPGDDVTLFDGSGVEFAARIVRVGKRDAELEIMSRREISREPAAADRSADGNLAHRIAGDGGENSGYRLCSTETVGRQTQH